MNSGIVERARERGLDFRNRRSMWMLGGFAVLGCIISISLTLLAGTSSYGVLLAAGGMLLAIPAIALILAAFPAAVANARTLQSELDLVAPIVVLHLHEHAGLSNSRCRQRTGKSCRRLGDA